MGSVLLFPSVLVLVFTSLIPLGYSFFNSFTNLNLSLGKKYNFVGFDNYTAAFKDDLFLRSLLITIVFVMVTVLIEIILGMLIALLFSRENRNFTISRTLLLLPMVSTPVVVGILWRIMLNTDYGVVNYFLGWFGFSKINWLGDPSLALTAIIAVDIWQWTPFIVLILIAALLSVPQELVEASTIDGANRWITFWSVRLPFILPVFLVSILLRFIDSFKVVDTVYVMTYGGPGNATKVVSMFIYQTSLKYFKIGYGSAISILFIIVLILVSFPFIRQRLNADEVN